MRRGIPALLPLLACLVTATVAAAATSTDLSPLLLTGADIGPGYVAKGFIGGRQVAGQVTLDLCNFSYASETLRTARAQDSYIKPHAKVTYSNEVVSYRPGGVAQVLREVAYAIQYCSQGPAVGPTGVRAKITNLTVYHVSSLPQALVLSYHESGVYRGRKIGVTNVEIIQTHGNIVDFLYASNPGSRPFSFAATTTVARKITLRLQRLG